MFTYINMIKLNMLKYIQHNMLKHSPQCAMTAALEVITSYKQTQQGSHLTKGSGKAAQGDL